MVLWHGGRNERLEVVGYMFYLGIHWNYWIQRARNYYHHATFRHIIHTYCFIHRTMKLLPILLLLLGGCKQPETLTDYTKTRVKEEARKFHVCVSSYIAFSGKVYWIVTKVDPTNKRRPIVVETDGLPLLQEELERMKR